MTTNSELPGSGSLTSLTCWHGYASVAVPRNWASSRAATKPKSSACNARYSTTSPNRPPRRPRRLAEVRILQHEPTNDQLELDHWLDTFGSDETISELVISCALSDQAEQRAADLIRSWITVGRLGGEAGSSDSAGLCKTSP